MDRTVSAQASDVTAGSLAEEFRVLFDRECGYVLASLRRLGVPERDCEDVANEVFVRVHRKISELDRTRPVRPWLFAFCARLASDYRRLRRHRVEVLAEHEPPGAGGGAEEEIARAEDRAVVARALDALDEDKRAVFVLHDLDETPIPEVARVLEIAEGTAYSRLRAARAEFTAAVRRDAARTTRTTRRRAP
jgi:RNA polymerase sigma-70 factor (ECF subfamily)